MSIAVESRLRMSLEEFLEWPGDGRARHYQLIDGEVRPMSPARDVHGTIQANVTILIGSLLTAGGRRYRIVAEAAIVPRMRDTRNLRIADLAVTASPNVPGRIPVPDPILVVEILSPGNERETREAVRAYTSIPSVQEILVVRSTKIAAELLRRGADGAWPSKPEEIGPDATVRLDSVGLSCPIEDFYASTHLLA